MVMTITGAGRQAFSPRHESELPQRRPRKRGEPAPAPKSFVRRERPHSEQARAEMAAVYRAIGDAEEALAIVAAADAGLARSGDALAELETGLQAAAAERTPPGAAGGDPGSVQAWIAEMLAHLERVAVDTHFGDRRLLDGSLGCAGLALGDGLSFVSATEATRSSPAEGYEVLLSREPARATLLGETAPTPEAIDRGLRLELACEGRRAVFTAEPGQTPADVAAGLRRAAAESGLPLHVDVTSDGRMLVQHTRFGAANRFEAVSSVPGVLSDARGAPSLVANGADIAGTINEEPATGDGQTLTGAPGNPNTDGLTVRYTGLPYTGETGRLPRSRPAILEPRVFAGRIVIVRQALAFRFHHRRGGTVFFGLDSVRTGNLGRRQEASVRFASLAEIQAGPHGESAEALEVVRLAAEQVAGHRRRLGELTRERLRPILQELREQAAGALAGRATPNEPETGGDTMNRMFQQPVASGDDPGGRLEVSIDPDAEHAELDQVRRLSQWIRESSGPALNAHARPSRKTLMGLLHGEEGEQVRRHPVIEVRG